MKLGEEQTISHSLACVLRIVVDLLAAQGCGIHGISANNQKRYGFMIWLLTVTRIGFALELTGNSHVTGLGMANVIETQRRAGMCRASET